MVERKGNIPNVPFGQIVPVNTSPSKRTTTPGGKPGKK